MHAHRLSIFTPTRKNKKTVLQYANKVSGIAPTSPLLTPQVSYFCDVFVKQKTKFQHYYWPPALASRVKGYLKAILFIYLFIYLFIFFSREQG